MSHCIAMADDPRCASRDLRSGPAARTAILLGAALLFAVPAAFAGEGWEFSLGAGGFASSAYPGSDERFLAPVPMAKAAYSSGGFEASASVMEGLGLRYVDMEARVFASLGLNFGEKRGAEEFSAGLFSRRHDAETRSLLEGSPETESLLRAGLKLGWISPVGVVGASLDYHPTRVEGAGLEHGLLGSAFWLAPVPLSDRLTVTAMLALEAMDGAYAEAWHSVGAPTAELEAFEARAGLRSCLVFLGLDYAFAERWTASLVAANAFLLADAARSPYTRSRYQPTFALTTAYAF